jgi:flagellar basal-body rod protein FlgB
MPITLEDAATRTLASAMSGLNLRQRVIGNNLANLDTPGFKASEVNFAEQLARASGTDVGGGSETLLLVGTDARHLGASEQALVAEIETKRTTSQRVDGNNVDIEKEMEQLSETMIHYQTSARLLSRRLATLKTVITGGRGA